ncbi:hypothetical protein 278BB001_209 [Bacillus phage 278BB001]|nr:hypothetical protein 278BB001_209 [Bacillus phage 278BB001]
MEIQSRGNGGKKKMKKLRQTLVRSYRVCYSIIKVKEAYKYTPYVDP